MTLPPVIRDNRRSLSWFFILLSTLFLSSCDKLLVDTSQPYPPSAARLILYIHSNSKTPPDIDFSISEIDLETEGGKTIKAAEGPIDVSSLSVASGQLLLKEAAVEPGLYRRMKLKISRASVKKGGGRVNLALPEPDGLLSVRANFEIHRDESFVTSLEWDPGKSVEGGYRFQPGIVAELQMPSPRGLLLFVSNSGSNFISIIDRSLERVIGAVTTGDRPMGMALNSTQDQLYVVNSGAGNVSVVDTSQFRLLSTIPLPGSMGPADIVFIPDPFGIEGKIYITNRLSNDVTVVNTATRNILKLIPVGNNPSHIASDTGRKEIYVTNEDSNDLSIISTIDDTVVATIAVNRQPTGITVVKDKLYIFNQGSNSISIVSTSQRQVVGNISLTAPPKRGINGFGGKTFIANTSVDTVTSLNSFDVTIRSIPLGRGPIGFAGDEVRNRLYITNYGDGSVSLMDPVAEIVLKKLFVGKNPYGLVLIEQ